VHVANIFIIKKYLDDEEVPITASDNFNIPTLSPTLPHTHTSTLFPPLAENG